MHTALLVYHEVTQRILLHWFIMKWRNAAPLVNQYHVRVHSVQYTDLADALLNGMHGGETSY